MLADAGQAHSLAIKSDGSLWAWGWNLHGQLGDSTNDDRQSPVLVDTSAWVDVSAGGAHSLAIKSDSTLWACGFNGNGQLGDSSTNSSETLIRIGSDTIWTEVAAGFEFSMALKENESLWSWGFNGNGQLGDGSTSDRSWPEQIGSSYNWIQMASGSAFAFAIRNDSVLFGWGYNNRGQLGDGSNIQSETPLQIGVNNDWRFVAASEGVVVGTSVYGLHSLGLRNAESGVCGTGANYVGQLGDSTTVDRNEFQCDIGIIANVSEATRIVLSLWPNPAQGHLSLTWRGREQPDRTVLTDILGRNALDFPIDNDRNYQELNVSQLASGLYICTLQRQGRVLGTTRVIVE
jgi:alpha-tubulin suppressor-like RCC1 family protein